MPPATTPTPISTTTTTPTTSTRLYISPCDAATLPRLLPADQHALLHPSTTTFHTLPAFPEKPFAYIDLPAPAAEQLRRKLHGSILKGAKMRVEHARPETRKRRASAKDDPAAATEDDARLLAREERRSKRKRGAKPEDGVLKGVELPDNRRVKRGWTSASSSSAAAATGANADAVVFRTRVPPAAAAATASDTATSKSKGKARRAKRAGKHGAEITDVTEGANATPFPTFLRTDADGTDAAAAPAAEFVDGQGWLDASGALVEAAPASTHAPPAPTPDDDANDAADDHDDDENASEAHRSRSASAPARPTTETPAPAAPDPAPSALESLFKRPRSPAPHRPPPVKTFSFFSTSTSPAGDDDDDDAAASATPDGDAPPKPGKRRPKGLMIPPQTPFTRRDLDARALRSAAPTPDTAALGRKFRPWARDGSASSDGRAGSVGPSGRAGRGAEVDDQGEDHDDDDGEGKREKDGENGEGREEEGPKEKGKEEGQNAFEAHFYAARGEYNRAWKARARDAKKKVRQAENRRGGRGRG